MSWKFYIKLDGGTRSGKVRFAMSEVHGVYQFADQESREIVDWLSPLNFWTKQDDILSKKEEGTGGWIFEDPAFEDWINGTERILWCPGIRMSLEFSDAWLFC